MDDLRRIEFDRMMMKRQAEIDQIKIRHLLDKIDQLRQLVEQRDAANASLFAENKMIQKVIQQAHDRILDLEAELGQL